jgi:hypothetical protein
VNGPVEDICGADFHLHDAELVAVEIKIVVA